MPKQPFTLRAEDHILRQFDILRKTLSLSSGELFEEAVHARIDMLSEQERKAFQMLLSLEKSQS